MGPRGTLNPQSQLLETLELLPVAMKVSSGLLQGLKGLRKVLHARVYEVFSKRFSGLGFEVYWFKAFLLDDSWVVMQWKWYVSVQHWFQLFALLCVLSGESQPQTPALLISANPKTVSQQLSRQPLTFWGLYKPTLNEKVNLFWARILSP